MELRRKGKNIIHKCSSCVLLSSMGREKGLRCGCLVLWLSLLLMEGVVSSELGKKTCTSSCGMIKNISYPFRLPNDPPHCGHREYELACENNVTLLHLFNGSYRVLGINYRNFTIRLVDEGIQDGNCTSLPLSSLSLSNFNRDGYPYKFEDTSNPYSTSTLNRDRTKSIIIKHVGYLKCSDPVREDAAYVDTAPCVKGGSHLYAVVGDLLAPQFKPQCRVKSVALVASDWESLVPGGIKSYADIHSLLSFGFELSWLKRPCADLDCTECFFIRETQALQCFNGKWTLELLRFPAGNITF